MKIYYVTAQQNESCNIKNMQRLKKHRALSESFLFLHNRIISRKPNAIIIRDILYKINKSHKATDNKTHKLSPANAPRP